MRSERAVVFLVGAVQFVNILDFMMVMPLGPDFARSLGIDVERVGVVAGAYTVAAGVSGLAMSQVLDRFDRRPALAVCMCGLALGTALGGLAWNLPSLVASRVVAGAFGGPATSLALAIVADVVPVERRGRAMAAVMGAFSVASVLGVPTGLYVAQWAGWRAPFFAVAAAGLAITAGVFALLPAMTGHLASRAAHPPVMNLLRRKEAVLSLLTTACMTFSGFLLIPNLSAFIQFNMGWPRDDLGELYMLGGALSFGALRVFGRLIDRFGPVVLSIAGAVAFSFVAIAWMVVVPPPVSVLVLFPCMMVAMSARNIAYQTLLSRVPPPAYRAAFQSLNGATQHMSSAAAAFIGAAILTSNTDGSLIGVPWLASYSLALTAVVPVLVYLANRHVLTRAHAERIVPEVG